MYVQIARKVSSKWLSTELSLSRMCSLEVSQRSVIGHAKLVGLELLARIKLSPCCSTSQPERELALAVALFDDMGVRLEPEVDLVNFQNIPALRSVPRIPHSHVFVRKRTLSNGSRHALRANRRAWRERSPWLLSAVESVERQGE